MGSGIDGGWDADVEEDAKLGVLLPLFNTPELLVDAVPVPPFELASEYVLLVRPAPRLDPEVARCLDFPTADCFRFREGVGVRSIRLAMSGDVEPSREVRRVEVRVEVEVREVEDTARGRGCCCWAEVEMDVDVEAVEAARARIPAFICANAICDGPWPVDPCAAGGVILVCRCVSSMRVEEFPYPNFWPCDVLEPDDDELDRCCFTPTPEPELPAELRLLLGAALKV